MAVIERNIWELMTLRIRIFVQEASLYLVFHPQVGRFLSDYHDDPQREHVQLWQRNHTEPVANAGHHIRRARRRLP